MYIPLTKLSIFWKSKLCALAILLFTGLLTISVSGQSGKKDGVIDLNAINTNLNEVLTHLKSQSGFDFFYDKEAAKSLAVNKLVFTKTPIREVLRKMRQLLPIEYTIAGNEVSVRIESEAQFNQRKAQHEPGKITGHVLGEKGEMLPGATIKVLPVNQLTQSGADGSYEVNIPAGLYTVEVSFAGYQAKRITEVSVTARQNTPLEVLLTTDGKSLSGVVVTASYKRASIEGLYARQKNNAAVSDGITAEQISRTPDNNTAQVLKRISGLQVSDNKYVVIRGLSDRYNNVLLNGAMLPSSEPNKRNFAFDMVPSAILDRIVVNKTATPDLTGEFTGGLVQVETKDIPAEDFLEVTLGTGFNTLSTGKEMIGLDRGKNAWIGFASDVHKKPEGMTFGEYSRLESTVGRVTTPSTDPTRQKMHAFLRTMPANWMMKKSTAMPVQNYQVQGGRTIRFKNDSRLGMVAALTYRNEQDIEKRSLYALNSNDFTGTNNKYITSLGGSLNVGYQLGKHKITLQNTYNRKFSDEMWKYAGVDGDNNNIRQDGYTNVTIINQLFQTQLGGEHTLGKRNIKVDWLGSAGWVDRDQPYSRQMVRLNGTADEHYPADYFGLDLTDNRMKNGNLFDSELKEKIYNWAANVQVPFRLRNLPQSFKVGYQGKYRTADFAASLFRMYAFNGSSYGAGVPYEQVFTQENFGKDLYLHVLNGDGLERVDAPSAEGYDGFQRLNAFYGMFDMKPLTKLRLIGGVRAEQNDQNVFDYAWNATAQAPEKKQTRNQQTDWLPSINAIYSLTTKLNVRAAWYKTVARPDLRELSSFMYWDYDYFETVIGAPLQTTQIENADLRLEYYPAPGEVVSVSAFYKKFRNPIEMLIDFRSGGLLYRYSNLESALDKGIEVDFRKSLNFIAPASSFWQRLYLSGNFTLLDASVNFYPSQAVDKDGNPVLPKRERPLAGQSPYVVNGGIQYAGTTLGLNLAYNRYGKRIVFASPDRGSDEYENPRDILDLQVSYKFLKSRRAELRLNISDLLNQELLFYKNQFDLNNRFGYDVPLPSVDRYPGVGEELTPEQRDPKGTSYNKDYDMVVRRFRFGTTYTLNFIYRF